MTVHIQVPWDGKPAATKAVCPCCEKEKSIGSFHHYAGAVSMHCNLCIKKIKAKREATPGKWDYRRDWKLADLV